MVHTTIDNILDVKSLWMFDWSLVWKKFDAGMNAAAQKGQKADVTKRAPATVFRVAWNSKWTVVRKTKSLQSQRTFKILTSITDFFDDATINKTHNEANNPISVQKYFKIGN